jgi:hypothetical protein
MTIAKPETLAQAQHWDRAKAFYVRAGLCLTCAAQAAWGHQQGFNHAKPPCPACLPVLLTFPRNERGEWRSVPTAASADWIRSSAPSLTVAFLSAQEAGVDSLHPLIPRCSSLPLPTQLEPRATLTFTAA